MATEQPQLLKSALWYARRGIAIHPLRPRDKVPTVTDWPDRASTDVATLRAWWAETPSANVGCVPSRSGLVVIDVDPRNGGMDTWREMKAEHGAGIEDTVICETGGGGLHLYYRANGHNVSNGGLGPGVEVKSLANIVMPPSVHPLGSTYGWAMGCGPHEREIADLPDRLAAIILAAGKPKSAPAKAERIPEGQRNDTLASLAGSMRRRGMSEEAITEALLVENGVRCDPPLAEAEVKAIAKSVSRYEPDAPLGQQAETLPGTIGGCVPGKVLGRLRRVCAADLRAQGSPTLDYLPMMGCPGYVVRGWTHLVAGYPKAGKTELVTRLCHEWQGERILFVTEEPESIWAARLAKLEQGWDHVALLFGLGVDAPSLLAEIEAGDETIVIIDTVRNLLALKDETDNSEIARVLTPYIVACRSRGKTLVLLHHVRKGGGSHGEGITGGHAFLGVVDIALELLREENLGGNRRRIRGWGRVAPIPEMVCELDDDGSMSALGDPAELAFEQVKGRALEALNGEWRKTREVYDSMAEPRPSLRQVRAALNALFGGGIVLRDPTEDKPGATYRYRLATPEPGGDGTLPGTALPRVPGKVSDHDNGQGRKAQELEQAQQAHLSEAENVR